MLMGRCCRVAVPFAAGSEIYMDNTGFLLVTMVKTGRLDTFSRIFPGNTCTGLVSVV